jgi:catechol 2,3-dioxygenase-like lactoylglutathione lyase family enzyme
MIDHHSFAVKNYQESLKFYDETLSLLGYKREVTLDYPGMQTAGYGNGGPRPKLWISEGGLQNEEIGKAQGLHIAFVAPTAEAVQQQWYKKALALGAKDNAPPGPRTQYHDHYCGAFVIDPNGWRIEACLHDYRS